VQQTLYTKKTEVLLLSKEARQLFFCVCTLHTAASVYKSSGLLDPCRWDRWVVSIRPYGIL